MNKLFCLFFHFYFFYCIHRTQSNGCSSLNMPKYSSTSITLWIKYSVGITVAPQWCNRSQRSRSRRIQYFYSPYCNNGVKTHLWRLLIALESKLSSRLSQSSIILSRTYWFKIYCDYCISIRWIMQRPFYADRPILWMGLHGVGMSHVVKWIRV